MHSSVVDLRLDAFAASVLSSGNILRFFFLFLAYRLGLLLYNISPLHPLYRFPGPKLAAASFVYEFFFDFVLGGRYTHEIKRLHELYGPIVRINPEELHCNDPDFADEIYAGSGRVRDKQRHYLNTVAGPLSTSSFATIDHETHRVRRAALARFFSRAQMTKLEPEVHDLAQRLCDKMLREAPGQPLNMIDVYNCFTADTISQYAYGVPLGFLAMKGWGPNFKEAFDAFSSSTYLFRFVPVMKNLVHLAPYLAKYMPGPVKLLMREMTENIPRHIHNAIQGRSAGRIFTELLESSLPETEKTLYRLSGEGFSLMAAGSETTASTLTVITYYLLAQPALRARLMEELRDVDPQALSWAALEKRPYLWAVINEGLRLSYGLSPRSPRIARNEDLVYQKGKFAYVVPRGTPIGMSAAIAHHNEDVFDNSEAFVPERWLDEQGGKRQAMEKYLFSFNRGSRQCLGMNLAMCELFLVTAAVVVRVMPRMQLHETSQADVRYDYDLITPQVREGSRGVRVTLSAA